MPNAAWIRAWSSGETTMFSIRQHDRADRHPDEVDRVRPGQRPRDDQTDHRNGVHDPRHPQRTPRAEPRRYRLHPVPRVEIDVHQRVDHIEAEHPRGDGEEQEPRCRREVPRYRDPRAERGQADHHAEHEMAQPREALGVGVDHKSRDRDRPQVPGHRRQLADRDQQRPQADRAEHRDLAHGQRARSADPDRRSGDLPRRSPCRRPG